MPESGSVVKALEMATAFLRRTRPELQVSTVDRSILEALPLAREQEGMLRAYVESHRGDREFALQQLGIKSS